MSDSSTAKRSIYLDHAAATPLAPEVIEAMTPYLAHDFYNPSSVYAGAREVRTAVETARHTLASILGVKATEITFTASATESLNLAIGGVLERFPGASWVTCSIEHEAVLAQRAPLEQAGHSCRTVGVTAAGIVSPAEVAGAITDDTVLISLMLANNEIGTLQPVARLASLISTIRAERERRGVVLPLYLHTDATQAGNYLSLQINRLGVDMLTLNGSKLYGPKGTGLLYVHHTVELSPRIYGGGQERGRRSGTENVAGIIGLATAVHLASTLRATESRRLRGLRNELIRGLTRSIPGIRLNGDLAQRLPNNLNLTIPGAEGEALVLYLDNAGIQAATGSACSAASLEPSHVIQALGYSAADAQSSLRLTLGRSTTAADIAVVLERTAPVVARVRQLTTV